MKRYPGLAALVAVCFVGLSPLVAAQDSSGMQQMGMDELSSRLQLTADQQSKIQPLMEARRAKLESAHSKMASADSRHDKRAAMKEAKAAQDEFVRNVNPILNEDQQAQWEKMRAAAREEMKDRWRDRKAQ